jgi:hypothetical protein
MRQIEMLQTQHAIASQNWQKIEGSLQHRNEGLEREKSDLMKKLDEDKKKLRDAVKPTPRPRSTWMIWMVRD